VADAVPLRPRRAGEIVDAAFRLVASHYAVYVMIAALFTVPAIILSWLMYGDMQYLPSQGIPWRAIGTVFLAGIICNGLADACAVTAMSEVYLGRPLDAGAAFARTLARAGDVVLAAILRWTLVFGGMLLLLLPGLYVGVRTTCLNCGVMLDRRAGGAVGAFRRSWELAEDHESHVFATAALSWLLYFVGYAVILLVVRGAGAAVPALRDQRVLTLVRSVLLLLVVPVLPAVRTVLYYDLRVRKEGLDVELLAEALAPPAA